MKEATLFELMAQGKNLWVEGHLVTYADFPQGVGKVGVMGVFVVKGDVNFGVYNVEVTDPTQSLVLEVVDHPDAQDGTVVAVLR